MKWRKENGVPVETRELSIDTLNHWKIVETFEDTKQKFKDDPEWQEYMAIEKRMIKHLLLLKPNQASFTVGFDSKWDPLKALPNLKIDRCFSFGGVRRMIKIPVSMPHRVIIEPNMPRQGYSHMTWNSLNGYYLENVISKSQYAEFLSECAKLAYKVYSKSRHRPDLYEKGSF